MLFPTSACLEFLTLRTLSFVEFANLIAALFAALNDGSQTSVMHLHHLERWLKMWISGPHSQENETPKLGVGGRNCIFGKCPQVIWMQTAHTPHLEN